MDRETWRVAPSSIRTAGPTQPTDTLLPVRLRAQLGAGDAAEIVHAWTFGHWRHPRLGLARAQEGSVASDWAAGTPLTWLRDNDSRPVVVANLGADLAAADTDLDLSLVYRRFRIDDELCHVFAWEVGSVGKPMTVRRGQEGTIAAPHASGAEIVWLAADGS